MFLAASSSGGYAQLRGASTTPRSPVRISSVTATAIALMLFVGACGKSAQLPLYVWLPDAMEGPTPVSALIHAATMVTAGVYLMTRINPLLALPRSGPHDHRDRRGGVPRRCSPRSIAVAQNDIKKVLAYSTVSQLGYMFIAVGSGAYVAAIFHMVTHAFFKALLFLGSGSVIHGMHHEQDMRRMGALRKVDADHLRDLHHRLAGHRRRVPTLSGFWSKDEIVQFAWDEEPGAVRHRHCSTALLTAYYMTRQVMMVFFGAGALERPPTTPWWRPAFAHGGDITPTQRTTSAGPRDRWAHARARSLRRHESPPADALHCSSCSPCCHSSAALMQPAVLQEHGASSRSGSSPSSSPARRTASRSLAEHAKWQPAGRRLVRGRRNRRAWRPGYRRSTSVGRKGQGDRAAS